MRLFSSANGVREHRMLYAMQQSPEALPTGVSPLKERIDAEIQAMDARVKNVVEAVGKNVGFTYQDLSPDRKGAIGRQQESIAGKFRHILTLAGKEETEYKNTRDALLREVDELVWYAEFQAAQAKENLQQGRNEHSEERIPLADIQMYEKAFYIRAPKEETMNFTYVSRSPEIARVMGVMTFDKNTVSMHMRGTFLVERAKNEAGEDFFKITPDAAFDGTFTVYIGGKSKTIDWMNAQSRELVETQKKEEERNKKSTDMNTQRPDRQQLLKSAQDRVKNAESTVRQREKAVKEITKNIALLRAANDLYGDPDWHARDVLAPLEEKKLKEAQYALGIAIRDRDYAINDLSRDFPELRRKEK